METQVKVKPKLKVIKDVPNLPMPGEVGAILELTVKDKDGKIVKHRIIESKCFVRQFLELLYVEFQKLPKKGALVIKDTGGLGQRVWNSDENFDCDAAATDEDKGIIVGSGTTAPTIDDYKMETPIAHGSGATELEYSAVIWGTPTADATTSTFTITRDFTNAAAGGAITVNEIGLYVRAIGLDFEDANKDYYFLIIRDVISGGISVDDGQTLTVNYREQVMV